MPSTQLPAAGPGGSCVEVAEGEAQSRDTLKSCCFSKQPSLAIRANVGV